MRTSLHALQRYINACANSSTRGQPGRAAAALLPLAVLGAFLLITPAARAGNILLNGNFNLPASGSPPTGWTGWTWGGGWANHENNAGVTYDGSYYLVAGGSSSAGGGFNQIVTGAPGLTYTLSVLSGADAWWLPYGEMRLFFYDSTGTNQLGPTVVKPTVDPAVYGQNYDIAHPWAPYSVTATAPPGTAQIKVEFAEPNGTGSVWFENADLEASIPYPVIANVTPDGTILMQVTNTLSFTASSGAAITNIQVLLNGLDVSSNLVVTGSATNKSITYSGLKTNQAYSGTITVKDANNLSASVPLLFDTFKPVFTWEAEDFDYSGGLYINSPVLSSTSAPGSYFGLLGTQGIDENDIGHSGGELYRTNDYMATGLSGDTPRQNYLTAQATDPAIQDYSVGYFDAGEWVNYTRSFPAGKFNIYVRLASGNSGVSTIYLDKVTGGQGTATQTTTPLGSFKYTGTGWGNYQYVPLVDTYGNMAAVDLNGVTTLRVTAGAGNMNFFLLVPAQLDKPVISNVYPDGSILMQVTNKLVFSASSASATIPTNGVHLTLNGVDVTSSLVIAGSSTSKSAIYTGLKTNMAYTAVVNVTDANGSSATSTIYFDTFQPSFVWEAEDWDFNKGQYINDPVPSSTWAGTSYFGQRGVQGVDENETGTDPANQYRSGDAMNAGICGDVPRQKFLNAKATDPNVQDWNVGYFDSGEWVNYTRNFPSGTYNLYARVANGNAGTATVYLDQVTSGQGTSVQGTLALGSFLFPAQGWNTYSYAPLLDRYGNYAELTLNGVATLRARAGGANMNFFMLAPPRTDLPRISNVYPDGTLELQATNVFRFTASNPTVPIYRTNISLVLNGVDVTSQLTISGSPSSWNVSMPLALNVGRYSAAITVRDANTNMAATTIYFDTFNPGNFTWEAEDFDFNDGQFIDNPVPTSGPADNSYFGLFSDIGVDFNYETMNPGTPYTNYMRYSLGIEVCGDYPPLAKYVTARVADPNVKDYNVGYWTSNSWANYTHTYPAGTYNVYGRMASGTGGSVQLDKVTGGPTTHLGQFNLPNWGWGVYSWWPLVDANGQLVTVSIGGTNTLRATTDGSANANRYMLVTPLAAVTSPRITATLTAGAVVLSFPTQPQHLYQVWGKNNLTDPTWSPVATLSGNGSVQSWSEPASQAHRFYRLAVQ
jgi:hypothetical protein